MQLACLCGAALLLSAVLFSGTMRARLKIFISKHFYQGRYDYREEWQHFTRALAEDAGSLSERAIQAVAGLVESPAGTLWLRRGDDGYQPRRRLEHDAGGAGGTRGRRHVPLSSGAQLGDRAARMARPSGRAMATWRCRHG